MFLTASIIDQKYCYKHYIISLGYRLPMTWPFLGAVGSSAIAPTAQATTLTPPQQLVLAPRATQRRRYNII